MPELPEVETVRRMLERAVLGRTVRGVRLSRKRLREPVPRGLPARLRGRRALAARRVGKYLMLDFSGGVTLLSHLGMSGRWLFFERPGRGPERPSDHVHARIAFADGAALWFEDPRRFGLLRTIATARAGRDRALATLGPDPLETPPTGPGLAALGRGARVSVKTFLLDQRRIAGIGNIYASEILHRAGVDPRRPAGRLAAGDWERVAALTRNVLGEAIERMGTTFRTYRTLWNEPGAYGERLLVYDRAGEPCRACGTAVRRIVQGGRSTFFCPVCQPRSGRRRPEGRSGAPPGP